MPARHRPGDFPGLSQPAGATADRGAGERAEPVYDFETEDGVIHRVWIITSEKVIARITELFGQMDHLYIADGHHRAASAVRVGLQKAEAAKNPTGEEEFNYFLAVMFPKEQLRILDYNRVVKDLHGLSVEQFLEKLQEKFTVEARTEAVSPEKKGTFGLYVDGTWYALTYKGDMDALETVDRLDVSILQKEVLDALLGIQDPKTDQRIKFVGGIRGLQELEKNVDQDGWAAAFSMYPTSMDELLDIADAGLLMPPKSTWFEPKLRSGLFIHETDIKGSCLKDGSLFKGYVLIKQRIYSCRSTSWRSASWRANISEQRSM